LPALIVNREDGGDSREQDREHFLIPITLPTELPPTISLQHNGNVIERVYKLGVALLPTTSNEALDRFDSSMMLNVVPPGSLNVLGASSVKSALVRSKSGSLSVANNRGHMDIGFIVSPATLEDPCKLHYFTRNESLHNFKRLYFEVEQTTMISSSPGLVATICQQQAFRQRLAQSDAVPGCKQWKKEDLILPGDLLASWHTPTSSIRHMGRIVAEPDHLSISPIATEWVMVQVIHDASLSRNSTTSMVHATLIDESRVINHMTPDPVAKFLGTTSTPERSDRTLDVASMIADLYDEESVETIEAASVTLISDEATGESSQDAQSTGAQEPSRRRRHHGQQASPEFWGRHPPGPPPFLSLR
jgi:hypothetical protein